MRRTEQEFKAEILRRSEAYRRKRAEKRKKLMGVGICACLCIAVLAVFAPMGGASSDSAAPEAEMLTIGAAKNESAMSQHLDGKPEYAMEDAVFMEEAAAGEPNESPEAKPAAVRIVKDREEVTLDAADSAIIMEYLSSDAWIPAAANCLSDYTLYVNGRTYHYHSECGTIQDESCQSLTLSEADMQIFNDIMGRCPMRIG